MPTHLEASLQRDIDRIRARVTDMSGLGAVALRTCLKALIEGNRQLAYVVILRDQHIDTVEKEVDRLCLEFIARQQPVATPLRFVYSTVKINLDLERVGDYAESIARQSLRLMDAGVRAQPEWFQGLADLSIQMLQDATSAFVNQDVELARKTIEADQAANLMTSHTIEVILELFQQGKLPFKGVDPLISIARRFERVSDQARNICMETLYMCTGEFVKHPGAEAFRVLFVDAHNSSCSQMAEAIGNSLGQPRFVFASAGVAPHPIDQATIAFMNEKGVDVSRMVPKTVGHVPNIDHFHVIVALEAEAKGAFPQRPRKGVFLDWMTPDPSAAKGTPEEVRAGYERTYDFIRSRIEDLVEALQVDGKF